MSEKVYSFDLVGIVFSTALALSPAFSEVLLNAPSSHSQEILKRDFTALLFLFTEEGKAFC